MQKNTAVGETRIPQSASEGVVLTVLSQLKNGKIEEALAGFAEEFQFKDHGIALEFKDKERLAESGISQRPRGFAAMSLISKSARVLANHTYRTIP
jgi:hypothetical protein